MAARAAAVWAAAALVFPADALMFRSDAVSKQWDTWAFVENGTWFAYYLVTEVSYGEGFGVATSDDGTNWTDRGFVWHGPSWDAHRWWQGSSAVWRAADFARTGRYLINYSEMRPNGSQTITFAESFDLVHWTRTAPYDVYFPIDTRAGYNARHGRWDTIYSIPANKPGARDGYPRLGYWTASPQNGTMGFGITADGFQWTALPSPVMEPHSIGAEVGAVEWIGYSSGKPGGFYFALLGFGWPRTMLTYRATSAYGPFSRASKNVNVLNGSCYFLRFFRGVHDELLVTHQSWTHKGTHYAYIAPYKAVEVDDLGILRLIWWAGNEALKAHELPAPSMDPSRPHYLAQRLLPEQMSSGVIFEAHLLVPASSDVPPGFLLELQANLPPIAVVILPGGARAAVGDWLPQTSVSYSNGTVQMPTEDWILSGGAERVNARDPNIGGSDIRSGEPGRTTMARLAHPLDSRGHLLQRVNVCFQYVAGYSGQPRTGSTVSVALVDAINASVVETVWTSDELTNYSFDDYTGESPSVCGGGDEMSLSHPRQLQIALVFSNNERNVQLPLRTMNISISWGKLQPGPYKPEPLPSVHITDTWTRDLLLASCGEDVNARLMYRRGMIELYLEQYTFIVLAVPPTTGRIGFTNLSATHGVRWWSMSLPGGPVDAGHLLSLPPQQQGDLRIAARARE